MKKGPEFARALSGIKFEIHFLILKIDYNLIDGLLRLRAYRA